MSHDFKPVPDRRNTRRSVGGDATKPESACQRQIQVVMIMQKDSRSSNLAVDGKRHISEEHSHRSIMARLMLLLYMPHTCDAICIEEGGRRDEAPNGIARVALNANGKLHASAQSTPSHEAAGTVLRGSSQAVDP